MAARLRKSHQEDVRTKIKVSQLLNVLQDHALGTLGDLPASRVKAIEILLRKTLPDLSQQGIELSGGAELIHKVVYEIVDPQS